MRAQRTDRRDHPWKKVRIAARYDDFRAQSKLLLPVAASAAKIVA
jgi:hypothetical protein